MATKSTNCGAERILRYPVPVRENRLRQVRLEVMQVQPIEYLLRYVKLDPLFVSSVVFPCILQYTVLDPLFATILECPQVLQHYVRVGSESPMRISRVFQGTLQY